MAQTDETTEATAESPEVAYKLETAAGIYEVICLRDEVVVLCHYHQRTDCYDCL